MSDTLRRGFVGEVPVGTEAMPRELPTFGRWVAATTFGWLLGFVLVIVLAIVWDQVGGDAQFMVGMGMGAGVGYMQSRVIGRWVEPSRRWLWATTIGMGLPFLLWDLGGLVGIEAFFSLPLCVLVGSGLVGVLQSMLLRRHLKRTSWWIPASLVGWGVPAAGIALGDGGALAEAGDVLAVGAMFLGGAALGAVTGRALWWMPQRAAA